MLSQFFRFLRPIRLIKRKGVTAGLFGGDRKWLVLGGIVFVGGRIKALFGFGEPETVYVEELEPGKRLVIAHDEPRRKSRRRR